MMQHRRSFIQMGGLGLLSLFAPNTNATASVLNTPISTAEKTKWRGTKDEFYLEPDLTFLNNGTMGPSPKNVVMAVMNRIEEINGKGIYGGLDREAVHALANFVGVDDSEVAITHNVTEGINLAAWGLPLKKGDEVLLSTHEHVGNAAPWLNLARFKKVKIKAMPYGNTADETLEILKSRVTKKTRVIAIPHIPCTIGVVAPVKEICAWARSKNIMTVIDGAHGVGMLDMNLTDMGCDVYISCCHKWLLGPKGTGFIYVRKSFQQQLESIFTGGYSSKEWILNEQESSLEGLVDNAHKYYFGTQSSALYAGIIEAVAYHESIGKSVVETRIRDLNNYLFDALSDMNHIDILTPKEPRSRCGVVSFIIKNTDNHAFFEDCSRKRLIIRYVGENNLNCLRVSTHIYNDTNDIDRLLVDIKAKA